MSLVSNTLTAFEGAPLPDAVRKAAIQVLVSGARKQAAAAGADADAAFARQMAERPIAEHTQAAMRGDSAWTVGEGELFAAFVSRLNACHF